MKKKTEELDFIAIFANLISERLKIKQRADHIKKVTIESLFSLKQEFIKTLVEALFLLTGLAALILGIIMLLSKVISLEFVLIGYGLIVCILVLLRMRVRL